MHWYVYMYETKSLEAIPFNSVCNERNIVMCSRRQWNETKNKNHTFKLFLNRSYVTSGLISETNLIIDKEFLSFTKGNLSPELSSHQNLNTNLKSIWIRYTIKQKHKHNLHLFLIGHKMETLFLSPRNTQWMFTDIRISGTFSLTFQWTFRFTEWQKYFCDCTSFLYL